MTKTELSPRARELHDEATFVNAHDHMMFEYAIREALGESEIFDTHYAPALRKGGINVIATSAGIDHVALGPDYSREERDKILGANMLRVYRDILG